LPDFIFREGLEIIYHRFKMGVFLMSNLYLNKNIDFVDNFFVKNWVLLQFINIFMNI